MSQFPTPNLTIRASNVTFQLSESKRWLDRQLSLLSSTPGKQLNFFFILFSTLETSDVFHLFFLFSCLRTLNGLKNEIKFMSQLINSRPTSPMYSQLIEFDFAYTPNSPLCISFSFLHDIFVCFALADTHALSFSYHPKWWRTQKNKIVLDDS